MPSSPAPRARPLRRLLTTLVLALPLLEILVLVLVGQAVGGWATIGLVLLSAVLGAVVIKREGLRSWRALSESTRTGTMPERDIADSGLVLLGGLLLLLPGLISDALGLLLIVPVSRPLARVSLAYLLERNVTVSASGVRVRAWNDPGRSADRPGAGTTVQGDVIE